MGRRITMATREELVVAIGARYAKATRAEKGKILDEFMQVTGYHRKHAVRVLGGSSRTRSDRGRGRQAIYGEAVREALVVVWEASDRICGKRLKVVLPALVKSLEGHGRLDLDPEVRQQLLGASPATIDRLLAPVRKQAKGGRKRRRRASSAAKRQVSVRTFGDWDDPEPGFFEADFVAHNGGRCDGSFIHTLTLTDISSGWTECVALVVREQSLVAEGVESIRSRLPFEMRGLDTDNDGAFLNDTMLEYCRRTDITFTRSRAYHKNDQAWIEQKNGAVVRRLVGYQRLEGLTATRVLAELYRAARLYVNYFQPSFKLLEKTRDGAKWRKRYAPPATPCDRLLADPRVTEETKSALGNEREGLDPVALLHTIRQGQAALAAMTDRAAGNGSDVTTSLDEFLAHLPDLWREGEARPTHRKKPAPARWWRTHKDPFESVWPELLAKLEQQPDITGTALLAWLQSKYPGQYPSGQLRTLQRRVRDWRRAMARCLVYADLDPSEVSVRTPSSAPPRSPGDEHPAPSPSAT